VVTNSTLQASTASGTNSAIQLAGTGNTTRTLTVSGSTLSSGGGRGILVYSADSIVIDDCTVTAAGVYDAMNVSAISSLNVINSIIHVVSTGVGIETEDQAKAFTAVINNNTITTVSGKAINVGQYATHCEVIGNTINNAGVGYGVIVGLDADTSAHHLGAVWVLSNTVTGTTGESGHGILLGAGVNYAECAKNTISLTALNTSGLNIGIVVKGEGINIHDNLVKAYRCIYLKGGSRNKITNNTCYSTGGYALTWGISTDNPENNTITNNIFDASGGLYSVYIIDGSHGNNYLDYNCYTAGSSGLMHDHGTTSDYTWTTWKAQITTWSLADLFWAENDAHSIEADPQFIDAANGNFKPRNSNLRIDADTYIGSENPVTNKPWLR
jgi:parallel beta-helix repeat protein